MNKSGVRRSMVFHDDSNHWRMTGGETSLARATNEMNHRWTQINTDKTRIRRKDFLSVFICVYLWLDSLSSNEQECCTNQQRATDRRLGNGHAQSGGGQHVGGEVEAEVRSER